MLPKNPQGCGKRCHRFWSPLRSFRIGPFFTGLIFFLLSQAAIADPMLGDVGAALASPETTYVNPANVVFLDRTQIGGSLDGLHMETRSTRYPGFPAAVEHKTGFGLPLSPLMRPSLVLRPTYRIGLSGFAAPPGLAMGIKAKKIPVIILGSNNLVDIEATGKVNFVGSGSIGFRVSERLGIGVGGEIRSISFNANLTPSDSPVPLATATGEVLAVEGVAGVRYEVSPGRLIVGLGVAGGSYQEQKITAESDLAKASPSAEGIGSSDSSGLVLLPRAIIGVQAVLGRLRLLGDIRVSRYDKDAEVFSLVDFAAKPRDIHDTVSPSGGVIINASPGFNLLGGFKYEPSPLGPGRRKNGDDVGLSGFGTIDLAQEILSGGAGGNIYPLIPYWQVAGGIQMSFFQETVPKDGPNGTRGTLKYYALTLGGGIGYRRSSLGVDADGELPGAYLATRIFFPVYGVYRF